MADTITRTAPVFQGAGSTVASVTQKGNGQDTAASATPKVDFEKLKKAVSADDPEKDIVAPQSVATAAVISDGASDHYDTTEKSAEPKSSSSEASSDFGSDLIRFDY